MKIYRIHALICAGAQCLAAGGNGFEDALKEELKKHDLTEEVNIVETGCMGSCQLGPLMVVYPEGVIYTKVKPEDAKEIVEEHFLKGRPVKRLLWKQEEKQFPTLNEVPFFAKQTKIVLRNCGLINPEDINEYIAQGGYEALAKALTEMTPEDVIKVIKDSGLRGRGGAGFPTGQKWEFAYKQQSDTKYIICNADEGDPGAYMDRSILEGDPHSVLEGMAIAGYAIGAQKGYIYVRAEYPLAVKRLEIAIKQARAAGLLGKNIFGTNFSFDIELRMGAGAFVCGEETALINSIEGKRGEPRKKPPFPAQKGVFGKPTVINNVETLANVPVIIEKGAQFFRKFGTEKSPGTKVFALAGKVNITGLVEVPLGTPLRTIVFDIGGGIPEGHTFKAAQTGGPSGGVIPAEYLDVPMDYENLPQLGTIMGSGGLIIMDETSCMVDVAKFFLKFTVDESCGKCTPCREGTRQMLNILEKITSGNGTMEDIDRLEKLGNIIKLTSLCGLGQTAPNPVLSTLRYFRDEYIAHIKDKKCPANVCSMRGAKNEGKVVNRRPA
ncbi:MAG: NADH-quinone oxidoreductase subunit NuoF [Caldisericum sp.]|jgi:NADH:ubiquinone oxidoreductase subunit F (NADH-binding)/(2Fe-2S) ferredoxin|nr:NADH-quinone oxidoreductase subunit NuoF [Caldisericum sp.]